MNHIRLMILLVLSGFLLSSCSEDVDPPVFNSTRAMEYVTQQVDFGPRVSGSQEAEACRTMFYELFRSLGHEVDSQLFIYHDPYSGNPIEMVNVIIHCRGIDEDSQPILLMAHYDSRPWADMSKDTSLHEQPIAGANDGASGVAVLLELTHLFAEVQPPKNIDIVLFDGEDWGKNGDHEQYLQGSRHFAQGLNSQSYRFAILLDMVGDKDQRFYREGYSERFFKEINDLVWSTAQELGYMNFVDSLQATMLDDHLPLQAVGIPTIDVIDFDYPYWHTEHDTPDKCSAEALGTIGEVITRVVYSPGKWPVQ